MFVRIHAGFVQGVQALPVTIEVNIGQGMKYAIVGLPDSAIRESYQRIDAALKNTGFKMPRQKILVNLAPADLRKEGTAYDLSIACGILAASGQVDLHCFEGYQIMGELSLDGTLKSLRGVIPLALLAAAEHRMGFILPALNAAEACAVKGLKVIALGSIEELHGLMKKKGLAASNSVLSQGFKPAEDQNQGEHPIRQQAEGSEMPDLGDIKGQEGAKRALEVAAAGGHNIILIGSPGSGKTMLAQACRGLLPALDHRESLEASAIHSVAGLLSANALLEQAPFRAPHHTVSSTAMAGGGSELRPGEISLAHHGILFLDELPEFGRASLEVLRQPMEEGCIRITRAKQTLEYPASFILLAAMNSCPCGNRGHPEKICTCAPGLISRYLSRVSGPLMDRIDIHLEVSPMKYETLRSCRTGENSFNVRARVLRARQIQKERLASSNDQKHRHLSQTNSRLSTKSLEIFCRHGKQADRILQTAMERLNLSARACHKILRVARTIADLEGVEQIEDIHLSEAIQYRSMVNFGH